ncbi:MAG: hypothetical protein ACO3C4_01580 [Candidatus Limnocylindrus sp.]
MNYANKLGYSDVDPYEIVRRVSERTLDVRPMRTERDPEWKPEFVAGGFCGTVVNQNSQRWLYESDPSQPLVRIRLGKQGWRDAGGSRYVISATPFKFYDYNF